MNSPVSNPAPHFGRRALFAGLAGTATLSLAACTPNPAPDMPFTPPTANSFVANLDGIISTNSTEPPTTLLPTDVNDSAGGRVVDQLFAGLVTFGADGVLRYEAAQSITSTDDTQWKITLRPGQKFTDGSDITAESFVNAWNYGALKTNLQGNSAYYSLIQGYDAVAPATGNPTADSMNGLILLDDLTFTVLLRRPVPSFPTMLGYRAFFPLPKVAYQDMAAFGEAPIGNGPYQMKSVDAWQHDRQLQLVRNAQYQGVREARNGGVTFVFYQDADLAFSDVRSDNLDVMVGASAGIAAALAAAGSRGLKASGKTISQLLVPQSLAGFANDEEGRLRRAALSRCIDRVEFCNQTMGQTCIPATDFTSYSLATYVPELPGGEVLQADASQARALWQQADALKPWGGELKVAYAADDPVAVAWAQRVGADIKAGLGIAVRAQAFESWAKLQQNLADRLVDSAVVQRWTPGYPSPFAYLQPQFSMAAARGAGANDGDYASDAFDGLLGTALSLVPGSVPLANPLPGDEEAGDGPTDETTPSDSSSASGAAAPGGSNPATPASADAAPRLRTPAGPAAGQAALVAAQSALLRDLPAIPLSFDDSVGLFSKHVLPSVFGWDGLPAYFSLVKVVPTVSGPAPKA